MTKYKDLGAAIGAIITQVANIDANKDGEISGGEVMGVVMGAVMQSPKLIEALKDIKKDAVNIGDLVEGYAQEFELVSKELEVLIEKSLALVVDGVQLGSDWMTYIKSLNA